MTEQIEQTIPEATVVADRKVILTRSRGRAFERKFFLDIQTAILDGFRIAETDLLVDESMRMFQGNAGRAVLYKEGTAPEKWTPGTVEKSPKVEKDPAPIVKEEVKPLSTGVSENKSLTSLEELATLSKVKELKEFAVKHELEIPEGVKVAKAIKKVLKGLLSA